MKLLCNESDVRAFIEGGQPWRAPTTNVLASDWLSMHAELAKANERIRELEREPVDRCADCGIPLNRDEAACFTVCDSCWNKHYALMKKEKR